MESPSLEEENIIEHERFFFRFEKSEKRNN